MMKMRTVQNDVQYPEGKRLAEDTHQGVVNLDNEVIFVKNLRELPVMANQLVRIGYNAVVSCIHGRVELEIGGALPTESDTPSRQKVKADAGQVLLLPANKLMQPMMVSTDVEVGILMVSDKVLREVLGPQITLWNRAMFLDEIHVIDGGPWITGVDSYARTFFHDIESREQFRLFREMVMSFLRTMFLMICEMLTRKDVTVGDVPSRESSTAGEKNLFERFMMLLAEEPCKRQHVIYYASHLNITPKYLSTVCKQVSGKSPTRWITESVMDDIYQQLRNTDLSVKEISHKMGFPNSSFFGQYFKEESGMTPLEYRNKSRGS
jgi:AraC-like DNA-binding protein